MSLNLTLILLFIAASLTALCGWRGARPLDLSRAKPRMMPWRFLMLVFAALCMLLLIHVAGLFGVGPQPVTY